MSFPYTAVAMVIQIIEAVVSILLILSILVQQRASGLTNSSGSLGGAVVQRRGAEKALHQASIVLSIAFFALIIVDWYI